MTTNPQITLADLRPGDIGFGPIGGAVGLLVGLGQLFLGDEARFRHVFVVVEPAYANAPALAVEAMPTGARLIELTDRWNDAHVFIRPPVEDDTMRWRIAYHAKRMIGTPYSFSDYLALFLKRLGINLGPLNRWISRTNSEGYPVRAICSQLADQALTKAGIQVFDDGRLSQNVVPGALFYQLLRIGGQAMWPGKL